MTIEEMQQHSRAYRDGDQPLISCLWWIVSEICLRLDTIAERMDERSRDIEAQDSGKSK